MAKWLRHRVASAALIVCATFCNGCGTGASSLVSLTSPGYLFTGGNPYTWVEEFGASNLPKPITIGEALETITGIAADASGNIISVGYDLGTFGGAANATQVGNGFVTKYNSSGTQLWAKQFGTGQGDFWNGVAVDAVGNTYVTGVTLGALSGFQNSTGTLETTVLKFDANGNLLWQTQFAVDSNYTYSTSVSCDPQGNPIIGGIYSPQNASQYARIYARKLNALDGSTLWTSVIGTNSVNYFGRLTTDEAGQVYLTGETTGPFPGQTTGTAIPFVASLAGSTGQQLWEQTLAVSGFVNLAPFAISALNGTVAVGGSVSNGFVTTAFNPDFEDTAFLMAFTTASGSAKWSKTYSTGKGEQITGVSLAPSGALYAAGTTNGSLAPGFTAGTNIVFLAKLAADGTNQWATQFGTGLIVDQSVPVGPQVSASATNAVYVGGEIQAPLPGFSNPTNVAQMFLAKFPQ